jgi:hypothetical protein
MLTLLFLRLSPPIRATLSKIIGQEELRMKLRHRMQWCARVVVLGTSTITILPRNKQQGSQHPG